MPLTRPTIAPAGALLLLSFLCVQAPFASPLVKGSITRTNGNNNDCTEGPTGNTVDFIAPASGNVLVLAGAPPEICGAGWGLYGPMGVVLPDSSAVSELPDGEYVTPWDCEPNAFGVEWYQTYSGLTPGEIYSISGWGVLCGPITVSIDVAVYEIHCPAAEPQLARSGATDSFTWTLSTSPTDPYATTSGGSPTQLYLWLAESSGADASEARFAIVHDSSSPPLFTPASPLYFSNGAGNDMWLQFFGCISGPTMVGTLSFFDAPSFACLGLSDFLDLGIFIVNETLRCPDNVSVPNDWIGFEGTGTCPDPVLWTLSASDLDPYVTTAPTAPDTLFLWMTSGPETGLNTGHVQIQTVPTAPCFIPYPPFDAGADCHELFITSFNGCFSGSTPVGRLGYPVGESSVCLARPEFPTTFPCAPIETVTEWYVGFSTTGATPCSTTTGTYLALTDMAAGKIKRVDPDTEGALLVSSSEITPAGCAADTQARKVYWIDRGADTIRRADLDGGGLETLLTSAGGLVDPLDIALDVGNGKMYWVDTGTQAIHRANLNGTLPETVVNLAGGQPRGIAVDMQAGKIYWTESVAEKVQRSNLDGTTVEDVISGTSPGSRPTGIAIDPVERWLYVTYVAAFPGAAVAIVRTDLDAPGTVDTLLTDADGLVGPQAIAVDPVARKLYWTDGAILESDLTGGGVQEIVAAAMDLPYGIAVFPAGTGPLPEPLARFTRVAIDFGEIAVDSTASTALQLENVGPLPISGVLTPTCSEFVVVGDPSYSLPPGGSQTFTIRFDPSVPGSPTALLSIDAGSHHARSVAMAGTALGPTDTPVVTAPEFELLGATPNPFERATSLRFSLPRESLVDLVIYDVTGRRMRTLLSGAPYGPGSHRVAWDGTDDGGATAATGLYFYRLEAGSFSGTGRVTLLR